MEQLTPPAIYSIVNYTMIHVFELPCFFRREAGCSINYPIGLRLPRDVPGYPACEPAATALFCLRSFQYSRTANFRAMATFATAAPRRNFNR